MVTSITFEILNETPYSEEEAGWFSSRSFLEGLFNFFFSMYHTSYKDEDCQWFLDLANKQESYISRERDYSLVAPDEPRQTQISPLHACGTVGMLKLYLSRILRQDDSERGNNVLGLHSPRVSCLPLLCSIMSVQL